MIKVTNDCVECASSLYPCIGDRCELLHVPHYYCDRCGNEVDEGRLYYYDREELCEDCILDDLEVVEYE